MSIEKINDAQGRVAYKVRWKDSAGRSRRKTVRREKDAILLDAEMKRRKAMGELVTHERGAVRLDEFWSRWRSLAQVSPARLRTTSSSTAST